MKSTTLKTLLFGLFLIATFALKAQENAPKKYEFVTVTQTASANIWISYIGKPAEKIKCTMNSIDHHELLEYVDKLQDDGWQVFSTHFATGEYTFVLRRLKK